MMLNAANGSIGTTTTTTSATAYSNLKKKFTQTGGNYGASAGNANAGVGAAETGNNAMTSGGLSSLETDFPSLSTTNTVPMTLMGMGMGMGMGLTSSLHRGASTDVGFKTPTTTGIHPGILSLRPL